MNSVHRGIFVISWSQTETDGETGAPLGALTVGSQWRWWGDSVRVDGLSDVLVLSDGLSDGEGRRRAARAVRRLVGTAMADDAHRVALAPEEEPQQGFVVTDGRSIWAVAVIAVPGKRTQLGMFAGERPPENTDLWVVRCSIDAAERSPSGPGGVICFTPGTLIATPKGERRVEELRAGDRISTADCGAQTILWRGQRRITGARLFATPGLRPVRIRAGAMGEDRPDRDLVVSPGHRMLVRGTAARALFNTDEVLVAARDLVNGRSVLVDTTMPDVTYIHLMTGRHQVIRANGIDTESFHPANAELDLIEPGQRAALLALMPTLLRDPMSYGPHVRRNLTAPEAAILQHAA
jgi:Hint domain